jgi:hypothetical protein
MAGKILRDKLGWKPGQSVLLLNLPEGMEDPFAGVDHTLAKPGKAKFDLVLAFTRDSAALAVAAKVILAHIVDDPKLWLAYPKQTGGIATDLNRDEGWKPMFDAGYRVVSIAAVDSTWAAVRFRPIHLVKSTRR